MKTILFILIFALFCSAKDPQMGVPIIPRPRLSGWALSEAQIPDGSNPVLTVANFIKIKQFILAKGLSRTYSQMYNNNPFYGFTSFNAYLNPDIGQGNISCDRTKSDFNHLVVQTESTPYQYWDIIWNRKGNYLIVQQAWSKISSQKLAKEVESIVEQILNEVEKRQ
jgi:hypothetical protein